MSTRLILFAPRPMSVLSYTSKAAALAGASLLAYWPCGESSGTAMLDASGSGRNGTYTGVVLGQPGIGDGRTCPLYDGINDFADAYSASLGGVFSGDEGTLCGFFKTSAWADATNRYMAHIGGATNRLYILKVSTTNQIQFAWLGSTTEQVLLTISATGWGHVALTWSKAADQVKAYAAILPAASAQVGATQTGLGTWSSVLTAAQTQIGGRASGNLFSGYLAHWMLCNQALSAATIAQLAVVP